MRIVTEMFRDQHSIPLLADLSSGNTAYISENYDPKLDLPVMRQLGTRNMTVNPDFLARLKADLDNNDASRWKSEDLEEGDWHTKVCDILLNDVRNPPTMNIVLKLDIIPLGRWHEMGLQIQSLDLFPEFRRCQDSRQLTGWLGQGELVAK